jgi:hypothetical protein
VDKTTPIIDELNRTRGKLLSVASGIPEKEWSDKATGGGWSPAEIIAHLTMVETKVTSVAAQIAQAPAVHVPRWKRFHLPIAFVQWRLIRVKTPIPLETQMILEKAQMLESFADIRRETVAFLHENQQRDLGYYRFPHPFLGSFHLYDWFRFLAFHEVRHTKQMQENVISRRK